MTEEDLILACAMDEVKNPPLTQEDVDQIITNIDVKEGEVLAEEAEADVSAVDLSVMAFDDVVEDLEKALELLQSWQVMMFLLPMDEIKKLMAAPEWWELIKLERKTKTFIDQWEDRK